MVTLCIEDASDDGEDQPAGAKEIESAELLTFSITCHLSYLVLSTNRAPGPDNARGQQISARWFPSLVAFASFAMV
jgi:hypothetical protein